jgi:hypothetical protein
MSHIKPTYVLPEPVVLQTDTLEKIEAFFMMVRGAKVPNQVQVDATPAFMEAVLLHQVKNQRPTYTATVGQLADDLRNNRFDFTGDTIKFSQSGFCIDGQHRAKAQVQSGTTVRHLCVVGLPDKAIEKMDLNRRRNAVDIHNTRCHTARVNPSLMMTAANCLEACSFDWSKARKLSTIAKVQIDDSLSNQEMAFVSTMSRALSSGTIAALGTLAGSLRAYRMFPEHGELIQSFLAATFANQPANPDFDPELSGDLYNYLNKTLKAKGSKQGPIRNQAVAVIKTVRSLVTGTKVSLRTANDAEINVLLS